MGETAIKETPSEARGARGLSLHSGRKRAAALRTLFFALVAVLIITAGTVTAAEPPRNTAYFYELAITAKPTIHDVSERIRIARGIDPGRMAEFSGMHEPVSFPGDTDPDADDFRDEAYGQLRAEIRMAYAELASVRGQAEEVRRGVELARQLVEISTTLYATGKIDQAQALQAQMAWERLSESLLLIEKREKVYSIRLNVLIGNAVEEVIPTIEPLREFAAAFDTRGLTESYKSRRFIATFQQMIGIDSNNVNSQNLHVDSLELESGAFISVTRVSLESLTRQASRYRTALIPRAEQAHTARLEAYKNGRIDFPALLECLRELSDMRREYQSILGEMHVLKARVESVTGGVLE